MDLAPLLDALPPDPARHIGGKLGVSATEAGTITTTTKRRVFQDGTGTTEPAKLLPRLPKSGTSIHWLLDGSFTMGSLIPHFQSLMRQPVALTVATLGMNEATSQTLAEMLRDGRLKRLRVAMSSYFWHADESTARRIAGQLKNAGATIAIERNHAKVQLYEPTNGRSRYVVETSSNLRSCNCVEVAAITNDPALFDWHNGWLTGFFERNAK